MKYQEPKFEIINSKSKDVIKTSGLELKDANYNKESANWNEQWNEMLNKGEE